MFIPDKAHKQNLPPYQHSVCAHLKYFTHRIHSSTLWSLEKRTVRNTQSASCSSSSVESSAKGTVRSVSESNGVLDGVGSRQTTLFRLFEGPRRAFDASRLVLDLVACLIFFFWVAPTKFLWYEHISLLFHREDMAAGSGLAWGLISNARRSSAEVNSEKLAEMNDGWSLVFTKAWWFTGAASVSSEARVEIVWSEDVLVTRKEACRPKAFSRSLAYCSSLVCIAELFANLVDGDDMPALGSNGVIFKFLGRRIFSGAPWKLYPWVHFVTVVLNGVQSGFVDLKVLSYWFRNETPRYWEWRISGAVTDISWWRRRKFFNHFLPVFSFLVQNWFLIPFLRASW